MRWFWRLLVELWHKVSPVERKLYLSNTLDYWFSPDTCSRVYRSGDHTLYVTSRLNWVYSYPVTGTSNTPYALVYEQVDDDTAFRLAKKLGIDMPGLNSFAVDKQV